MESHLADSCRLLSGRCIFQHHVLSVRRGCSLFRRMTTVSTLVSPVMTPLMVSLLASGTQITIKGLPMFVSIIETVILPVGVGFLLNYLLGKNKTFRELQKVMPGVRCSRTCMCCRRCGIFTGSQVLPVRCCDLRSSITAQRTWISAWIWSRKTGWYEYVKRREPILSK